MSTVETVNLNKLKDTEPANVAELFSELTLSITGREPAIVSSLKLPDLTDRDKEIVSILSKSTPEDLTDAIFNNPPKVIAYDIDQFDRNKGTGPTIEIEHKKAFRIKEPTQDDLDYANTIVQSPSKPIDELFQSGIKLIKNHLQAPTVYDDFEKHQSRRSPWEKGITNTLLLIDKAVDVDKPKDDDNDTRGAYASAFSTRFNNNRLAGTRGKVRTALTSIFITLNERPQLQKKIEEFAKIYDSEDMKKLAKENVEDHAKSVTEMAKAIIDTFTTDS